MKRSGLLIGFGCVVLALAIVLWPPVPPYDRTRVAPELRDLNEPYRSMTAHYSMDGGSIGFEIVDGLGKKLELAIPVEREPGRPDYGRMFAGSTDAFDGSTRQIKPTVREVEFNTDTRRMLCAQLGAQKNDRLTGVDDLVLVQLRRWPSDYRTMLWNAIVVRQLRGNQR